MIEIDLTFVLLLALVALMAGFFLMLSPAAVALSRSRCCLLPV